MRDEVLIYFFRPFGQRGPIKIGYTTDTGEEPQVGVAERLVWYARWSPVELEIAATVRAPNKDYERIIHNCFADYHSHSEWFHPGDRLLKAIEDLNNGVPLEEAIDLTDERGKVRWYITRETRIRNGTYPPKRRKEKASA